MKRILITTVFGAGLLISGCKATLSETALQTAVSEAIMTSSSNTAGEETSDIQDEDVENNAVQLELDEWTGHLREVTESKHETFSRALAAQLARAKARPRPTGT